MDMYNNLRQEMITGFKKVIDRGTADCRALGEQVHSLQDRLDTLQDQRILEKEEAARKSEVIREAISNLALSNDDDWVRTQLTAIINMLGVPDVTEPDVEEEEDCANNQDVEPTTTDSASSSGSGSDADDSEASEQDCREVEDAGTPDELPSPRGSLSSFSNSPSSSGSTRRHSSRDRRAPGQPRTAIAQETKFYYQPFKKYLKQGQLLVRSISKQYLSYEPDDDGVCRRGTFQADLQVNFTNGLEHIDSLAVTDKHLQLYGDNLRRNLGNARLVITIGPHGLRDMDNVLRKHNGCFTQEVREAAKKSLRIVKPAKGNGNRPIVVLQLPVQSF